MIPVDPVKTLPHVTISSTISLTMENISIVDDDFDDGNDIVEAGPTIITI